MKRRLSLKTFLTISFVFFFLLTQNIDIAQASADEDRIHCTKAGGTWNSDTEICTPKPTSSPATPTDAPKVNECTLIDILNPYGKNCSFSGFLVGILEWALVTPASWIMMAGGYFLDTVLKLTILNFHEMVGVVAPGNTSTGIYGIWVFIKSIINVIIVFELLFLAIQMILGKGGFVWE